MLDSPENIFLAIGFSWLGLFFGFLFAKIFFYQNIKGQRKDAVKKSRDVTLWYVHEKLAPILPNFPYNYKDLTFLGKWVDYVVFDGLSEWQLRQVVFLEIKSGGSRLNKNEQQIKNIVGARRVKHEVMRIKKTR